jgi:hypothetical protein
MRTTITLDDALAREVKREAARLQITVSQYLERAARAELSRQKQVKPAKRFKLITFCGDGPQPGVDLNRGSQVLEDLELAERG